MLPLCHASPLPQLFHFYHLASTFFRETTFPTSTKSSYFDNLSTRNWEEIERENFSPGIFNRLRETARDRGSGPTNAQRLVIAKLVTSLPVRLSKCSLDKLLKGSKNFDAFTP